ncbi:DedA family protein [Paenibacillus antibioticophila]|uniref:DedA family protein n=1 Tax=Paenibacillus antibioticophila TaxID=1274374 RepID=UPI000AD03B35|nr:VTT domain-containing protein [Paenibacillus antibioticophila]
MIDHYGYLFFYVALSLGPFGVPIPNEITVITGAILSRSGVLNTGMTYLSILSGLLTAITLFHFAGRMFGQHLKRKFQHNRNFQKAEKILSQRGDWAMCIGIFIPVVRYFLPFLIGFNRGSLKKFMLISYSSALVWTLTFFTAGTSFGHHILSFFSSF